MVNPDATAMTRLSRAALLGPLLGLGALASTGCNSGTPVAAAPSTAAVAAGPTPIAVNCGPGLQALIRPSLVAGQTISQVDCVPVPGVPAAVPIGYAGVAGAPVAAAYYDAPRMAEAPVAYRPAARPVSYQRPSAPVVPRKSGRSWQKSAIVIGSSAGVGAGVGGAIKGKKGALIGAAIGGGAATIWDQATRRR